MKPKIVLKTDPRELNHIKWAAWGVIDIESMERMQRRNYIRRARLELEAFSWVLISGGSSKKPYYCVAPQVVEPTKPNHRCVANENAFKKVCAHALSQLEPGAEQHHA